MARVLNPLDYVSGARTMIDFAHHELHDGSSFVTALTGTAKNDGTVINTHTGGTEIYTSLIPGAGKSAGGESRAEAEFVLAPNTGYVFEVESDASGLTLGLELDWYEHATSFVL